LVGMALPAGKAGLFLGIGACLWALSIVLWQQAGLDRMIQLAHNALRSNSLITDWAEALSTYGMASCILVFLVCFALSYRYDGFKDLQKILLPILLSFAIAGPVGDLSKRIFARPRPFEQYPAEIVPITRPAAYSLPSGHSTKSFALVLPFVVLAPPGKRRKIVKAALLLVAAAVAYSRIVLGVHFLSDILAGLGTAFIVLPLAATAANAIYTAKGMTEKSAEKLAAICGLILFIIVFYLVGHSL
jgi:membrane-associated phospholipid phosphatase